MSREVGNPNPRLARQEMEIDPIDKKYPMVFYCTKCSTIIGDSLSWLCISEDIHAIVLKRVNKVIECEDLTMSTVGLDKGSSYVKLMCASCSEIVGRMYKSTAPHLDDLRNTYHIYAPKIDSYTVGSACQESHDPLDDDGSMMSSYINQLQKLQQLVVDLNRRMSGIEQSISQSPDSTDDKGRIQKSFKTQKKMDRK